MSDRKTISASKSFFHKEFPFVIPSVYRKVIDEYLVELNLLSNQASFKIDGIFAYGLVKSFDVFTNGYQPIEHKEKILNSLCKSCDINYNKINQLANVIANVCKNNSLKDYICKIESCV